MKLHLGIKMVLAILAVVGVFYFSTKEEEPTKSPLQKVPPSTLVIPAEQTRIFGVHDVTKLTWTQNRVTTTWPDDRSLDLFQVRRHLALLAEAEDVLPVKEIVKPLGIITLELSSGKRLEAAYDQSQLRWRSGGLENRGLLFSKAGTGDFKDSFFEGPAGLKDHHLNICEPENLISLKFSSGYGLEKIKKRWQIVVKGKAPSFADEERVDSFLQRICHATLTYFTMSLENQQGNTEQLSLVSREGLKERKIVLSKEGEIFCLDSLPPLKSEQGRYFKSSDLNLLLKADLSDLVDLSQSASADFLDPLKTQDERVAAIRKVKQLKSAQAVPALRRLLFEDTAIDVYRYEAVDALAEIGNAEAFKVIADRLGQVKRSGFQLRLARALANALNEPFTADENTPEEVREPEVQELLSRYRKKPPGLADPIKVR